jgi:hypothetical protein
MQLSSSLTLGLRIFLPTLWIAFFGTCFIALNFTGNTFVGISSLFSLRVGLGVFIAIFLFVFWKTVFRLKRIDADSESVFITNYFTSVRYPHADVEKIEISKGLVFDIGTLVLKGKGKFGQRVLFVASRKRIEIFLEKNPQIQDWLVEH